MSTGSNKERLEQNNQSLEEIKLNAENLPEFVEINNQDKEITLNGDYTADAGRYRRYHHHRRDRRCRQGAGICSQQRKY